MGLNYEVLWAGVAEQQLASIIKHIHLDSPSAAKKQLERIKIRASSLTTLPHRGRVVPALMQQGIHHYRELVITPWRMIYRITDSKVLVLSVFDSRRNVEDVLLDLLVGKQ